MHKLTAQELDRLVRSNRNLRISLVVTLVLLVPFIVVVGELGGPPVGSAMVGAAIGWLLLIPQRRLLSELGLTRVEARQILRQERERRNGVAALPPEVRAGRELLRARIYLGVGLAFVVIAVASSQHFFAEAGKTHAEGTPLDPWFVTSGFAGLVAVVVGPALLWVAKVHRDEARAWQTRA